MTELVGAGRVEAHPDGKVLLAEDVDGEQDAAEVGVEVRRPLFADVVELAGEGVGRGEEGSAKRVDQGADLRRELGAGGEEVGDGCCDAGVDGLLLQASVFKERVEGLERGIEVGDPEQEQLLQRDLAVGYAIGLALEPLGGGDFAAIDVGVGELLGEGEKELFEFVGLDLGGKPADGFGEDVGVDLPAIAGHQGVAELVDEPHGEERTGIECAGGIGVGAAGLVEPLGQLAAGRDVGEDDVAAVAEELVVDLGCVTNGPRDVEFHQSNASK
jgi:hypothetical protein